LPEDVFLEGYGEVLPVTSKKICIGHGFRNSSNLTQLLRKNYGIESISVELIDSRYYHLDTCLCVLDSDTAFYYPYAFSRSSRQILENEFAKLYELSQEEAKNFAANSVIVGEKIVMQKNNPQLEKQLCRWGYIPLGLDISEFMKAGGGVHCLTLPLD
jgi:N-dimethylarginine dimethylaminohydrolase